MLAFVAVREQRAGADRQLPRDLDGERTQAVRRERFLDGRELAVRRAGAAERRRHRVAERFLGGDGAPQSRREARVGRERLAARKRAQRGIDDAELRACHATRELGAGLQLGERRRRAVQQALDEPASSRCQLALDAARGAVERRNVARRILIAGGRERFRGGGVVGGGGHGGCGGV